jgi:hypothetical protein
MHMRFIIYVPVLGQIKMARAAAASSEMSFCDHGIIGQGTGSL